jgi:hypothetical protein
MVQAAEKTCNATFQHSQVTAETIGIAVTAVIAVQAVTAVIAAIPAAAPGPARRVTKPRARVRATQRAQAIAITAALRPACPVPVAQTDMHGTKLLPSAAQDLAYHISASARASCRMTLLRRAMLVSAVQLRSILYVVTCLLELYSALLCL